jgi:hypothetical protein
LANSTIPWQVFDDSRSRSRSQLVVDAAPCWRAQTASLELGDRGQLVRQDPQLPRVALVDASDELHIGQRPHLSIHARILAHAF